MGEAQHRHYVLVGDEDGVLGIWEAHDAREAAQLRVQLELSYPGCPAEVRRAPSFDALKQSLPGRLEGVVVESSRSLSYG